MNLWRWPSTFPPSFKKCLLWYIVQTVAWQKTLNCTGYLAFSQNNGRPWEGPPPLPPSRPGGTFFWFGPNWNRTPSWPALNLIITLLRQTHKKANIDMGSEGLLVMVNVKRNSQNIDIGIRWFSKICLKYEKSSGQAGQGWPQYQGAEGHWLGTASQIQGPLGKEYKWRDTRYNTIKNALTKGNIQTQCKENRSEWAEHTKWFPGIFFKSFSLKGPQ